MEQDVAVEMERGIKLPQNKRMKIKELIAGVGYYAFVFGLI